MGTQALSAQTNALQNAGIKSTQLMPWRVNTTHTMGVDVIDITVGGQGGGSWGGERAHDPLTQNHRNGEAFSFTGGHTVTPVQNPLEFMLKVDWHWRMCAKN